MKHPVMKINNCKLSPIIGLGYWKDTYNSKTHGFKGEAHNVIIPFFRLQFGWLQYEDASQDVYYQGVIK